MSFSGHLLLGDSSVLHQCLLRVLPFRVGQQHERTRCWKLEKIWRLWFENSRTRTLGPVHHANFTPAINEFSWLNIHTKIRFLLSVKRIHLLLEWNLHDEQVLKFGFDCSQIRVSIFSLVFNSVFVHAVGQLGKEARAKGIDAGRRSRQGEDAH